MPTKAFVFSGGGAYAVPELGMVQYIEESHLFNPANDIAIGTSFGAIAAGSLTVSHSSETMLAMLKDFENISANALNPFSILWDALTFSSAWGLQHLISILGPYFGGVRSTTWPQGLITCATDLTTMQPYYFNDSTFTTQNITCLEAIAASASIPLLFAPVTHNSSVFVDGGIVENTPTTPAQGKDKIYILGNKSGSNYYILINSLESYLNALIEGPMFDLNEAFTKYQSQDNFIGFSSLAKNPLDFSSYEEDFEEGYRQAKQYFETYPVNVSDI